MEPRPNTIPDQTWLHEAHALTASEVRVTPHEVHKDLQTLTQMKGFNSTKTNLKTSRYWISQYTQDNDDEPFDVHKKLLEYVPGQDRERLILLYCKGLMDASASTWEILVHQGPNSEPENGDQIVLRMSREQFKDALMMT